MSRKDFAAVFGKTEPLAILVADDTPDLQALITMWLEDAGHHVTRAANGREILAHARGEEFDLLVTDILMPDGDGWEAIAGVHQLHPALPVLAISGGTREMPASAVLRVARGAGAIGWLEKPFSRLEFYGAILRVLSGRRAEAQSHSAVPQ